MYVTPNPRTQSDLCNTKKTKISKLVSSLAEMNFKQHHSCFE